MSSRLSVRATTVGCSFSRTTFSEKVTFIFEKVKLIFKMLPFHDPASFFSVLNGFGRLRQACSRKYFLFFWKCYLVRENIFLKFEIRKNVGSKKFWTNFFSELIFFGSNLKNQKVEISKILIFWNPIFSNSLVNGGRNNFKSAKNVCISQF